MVGSCSLGRGKGVLAWYYSGAQEISQEVSFISPACLAKRGANSVIAGRSLSRLKTVFAVWLAGLIPRFCAHFSRGFRGEGVSLSFVTIFRIGSETLLSH